MNTEPVVLIASAEFTLKSYPVRRTLEQRLIDDLRIALKNASFDNFTIEKHAARLVVRRIQDSTSAAQACGRVFGVAYAAPAEMVPASLDDIIQTIRKFADETISPGQSFAIRAHRSTPTQVSRREIEVRGGSEILDYLKGRKIEVDLTQPDVTISVDLADNWAFVYGQKLHGPSGLPISAHWKLLGILDSGPLSILAAYSMMRRGCLVELLIPTSTSAGFFERGKQLDLAERLRRLVTRPSYRTHLIQLERLLGNEENLRSPAYTFAKRVVRDAAVGFAKKKHFKGVVFSDVVGEIERGMSGLDIPIFRPLIGLESEDLLEICKVADISQEELASQIELENTSLHGPNFESYVTRNYSEIEPELVVL